MKKKKLSDLDIAAVNATDNSLALRGQMLFKTDPEKVSPVRRVEGTLEAGEEYLIPETVGWPYNLIVISHRNSGSKALILFGATPTQAVVVGTVGTISFGVRKDGSQTLLCYRETVSGPLNLKNKSSSNLSYSVQGF